MAGEFGVAFDIGRLRLRDVVVRVQMCVGALMVFVALPDIFVGLTDGAEEIEEPIYFHAAMCHRHLVVGGQRARLRFWKQERFNLREVEFEPMFHLGFPVPVAFEELAAFQNVEQPCAEHQSDGTYLFGATLLYKVNASTSTSWSNRVWI